MSLQKSWLIRSQKKNSPIENILINTDFNTQKWLLLLSVMVHVWMVFVDSYSSLSGLWAWPAMFRRELVCTLSEDRQELKETAGLQMHLSSQIYASDHVTSPEVWLITFSYKARISSLSPGRTGWHSEAHAVQSSVPSQHTSLEGSAVRRGKIAGHLSVSIQLRAGFSC